MDVDFPLNPTSWWFSRLFAKLNLRFHIFHIPPAMRQENLFGDCLVSAAFMSYAGPFGAAYRNELVIDEWMASVKEKDTA